MSYLQGDALQNLIDTMSDEDFDYLSDLLIDTVFGCFESTEFPTTASRHMVQKHLNTTRFDLQVAISELTPEFWDDDGGLVEVEEEGSSESESEADQAILQLALNSVTRAGEHEGESLTVAIMRVTVSAPFTNIKEHGVSDICLRYLPEVLD